MKSSDGELTIGELAADFGLATHVLRHWESVGVLHPARRVGDRRRYNDEHRFRVALILQAKAAGLSLEQIREVVEAPDGTARRDRLTAFLAELDERIERLRSARELVAHAVGCPHEDFLACARMREILHDCRIPGNGTADAHVCVREPFGGDRVVPDR
ncbi:MerR family transcriptional regulator [Nocardiopsis aegyptia]|uniref:DNA-binding transcriptional MerR regulator n=1 Tax=Nocardiopsis aegyptia TaxID=220378 RepID=A0A7Z0EPW9_9ACTN|nr:MerR family transcriptional regulator [Nocardiopsis aegyptia]NYJ36112.1 DNA-binding transcriptional MerR regulator [Nocardiopsis aegyptia]